MTQPQPSDAEPDTPGSAVEQIEALLRERGLDGLIGYLRRRLGPEASMAMIEDAISEVIDRIVRRGYGPKDDIVSYMARGALNAYRTAMRRPLAEPLGDAHDLLGRPDEIEHEVELKNAEAIARRGLEYLQGLLRRWDNGRMALVIELHLKTSIDDEPLSAAEVADLASGVLGEEMTANTARLLKHRGMTRLRRQLASDHLTDEEPP